MLIVAEHYAGSDTGRQRRANEDSLLARSPLFVVADGSGNLITSVATSTGAHSIAVDPATDHIFLPTQKSGVQVYTH